RKIPRHPRWTRQETLILIESKQVVETQGRKGRRSNSVFGLHQVESKWDTISSFCRLNGVNRGPVQCRKRWSNLVGDFRKIKTWESQIKENTESFWMMRNDLRREKKLPGFFDKEVYNVLNKISFTATASPMTPMTATADAKDGPERVVAEEDDEEETEAISDGSGEDKAEKGRVSYYHQLGKKGISSNLQKEVDIVGTSMKAFASPVPISEKQYRPSCQAYINRGMTQEKHSGLNVWRGSVSHVGWKRRRPSLEGYQETNQEARLIKVLEKSSSMLSSQLEAQNITFQLQREQLKEQNDSLIAALSKITDALGRIADKL
ncbi:hypothetical protein NMG60_11004697, partial [Bertholletia excelsa]